MAKTQTLSFPIRLPDSMQAEALRLLDASRIAINQIITDLWPALDLFAAERAEPAWKHVEKQLGARQDMGAAKNAAKWSKQAAFCEHRPGANRSSSPSCHC